jgi:hypothetical protein
MIELIALVVLIGMALYGYGAMNRESFVVSSSPSGSQQDIPYLSACPQGMNAFYLPNGRPACCDGPVTQEKCRSSSVCVMTGKGTSDMPNCAEVLGSEYRRKSNGQCPPSMPTYFEDPTTGKKGCTSGGLDADYYRPALPTQPTCWMYPTLEENLEKADSCALQKELEEAPCFGRACKKSISTSDPPMIMIQFQDDMGMYHAAYTRTSAQRFLNKTNPSWRESGINVDKNINIAEVAKAYYVDKTISSTEIQL